MDNIQIPTMAEMVQNGQRPEVLFWVGCAGSFDSRAQKVSKSFCKILNSLNISFAILGNEESCTGDPARRAGNEFVFQMLALQNIQTLNGYEVTRIVATCPHCFNVLKNEYPELGGHYEVIHHTQFLKTLMEEGKLKMKEDGAFKGKKITYHDSCYLGRANNIYEAPRSLLESLDAELVEMGRIKANGLCCGAGGAQMWKEDEPGKKRINIERSEEAINTGAEVIAVNCPFCLTMMSDGVKAAERQDEIMVYDLSELIINHNNL
jgi:heterodisulfide reductase subunit D